MKPNFPQQDIKVAAKIEKGEPVTAPGVPQGYPEPAKLVTEDCIRAAEEENRIVEGAAK
ncbi:MAG: hypothetical protein NT105_04030 [Verrucomicrobia bacterium]|nr:hypothetical protein [Verrucomicrobiota bacterium]